MRTLDKLNAVIIERKNAKPDEGKSYVMQLLNAGDGKICKKIGEEAAEIIIAALSETNERVVSESADLIFHLAVLWANKGINPQEIMNELEARMGISGLDEKAARNAKEKENNK
jgi:phosphoribosyl-ATP pyrophosphohydrolase